MQLKLAALVAGAVVVGRAAPAAAIDYEVPIEIVDEDDLYELRNNEQISDETLETLVELFQRGVDLNRAGREEIYQLPNLSYAEVDAILEYRELAGWIDSPAALVRAGVIDLATLNAIAAFLVVRDPRDRLATDGKVRAQTRWSAGDDGLPATALQGRVSTFQNLTAGFLAILTRNRLGDVRYDPVRDALSVAGADERPALPKVYVKWETPSWGAIAGTYRIGFGQRLTFDNTRLYTPNGFVLDDQLIRSTELTLGCKELAGELIGAPCTRELRITPDYRWQDGLLGVAVSAKHVPIGPGHLQASGFVSYQARDLYQYELYDAGACEDPRDDDDPDCAAPKVYHRKDDVLDYTSQWAYSSLPDVFAETTVGGNVAYLADRRSHVGVTAYTSAIDFLVEGMDLDFQEYSRWPRGGRFGAVGVDGSLGVGKVDLFAEATRSFDAIPAEQGGGGGYGGLVRAVTSPTRRDELELSLRYYGRDFANPNARAIAAADEVDGLRARDERGVRLRYGGELQKRLAIRAVADLWQTPSSERWSVETSLRGDLKVDERSTFGLRLQHHDKGLGEHATASEICFEGGGEEDEDGEISPCSGQRIRVTPMYRLIPTRGVSVVADYQHTWVDDPRYAGGRFRQDGRARLSASAAIDQRFAVLGRVRYYDYDLSEASSFGSYLGSFVEARFRPRPRDWIRLRYDNVIWFGESEVVGELPAEHWLWLSYESRY